MKRRGSNVGPSKYIRIIFAFAISIFLFPGIGPQHREHQIDQSAKLQATVQRGTQRVAPEDQSRAGRKMQTRRVSSSQEIDLSMIKSTIFWGNTADSNAAAEGVKYQIVTTTGDGNCFYNALSWWLFGEEQKELAKLLRQKLYEFMAKHHSTFSQLDDDFDLTLM